MQTSKPRNGSSEAPRRVSSRAVRQLKPTALEAEVVSISNQASRISKEKSPKVVDRCAPRGLVSEKKRPSRISELEVRNSQLQEELKKLKDQLNSSESCKKQSLQDSEEFKKQLLAMSAKLEMCPKKLLESASEGQPSLVSALNEIGRLKDHLEMVAESEAKQTKQAESAHLDLENLKGNLVETLSLVSNMKNRLNDGRESEAQATVLASETLVQLEVAKRTVEALRSKGLKSVEAYNSIASNLDQSRERVYSLEGLFNKLKANVVDAGGIISLDLDGDRIVVEHRENENPEESDDQLEAEISSLRSAVETTEIKRHEEQIQSIVQIKSAHELMDQIKSEANSREAELLAELEKANFYITVLKANLMDRESELQGISEENKELQMKLEKNWSCQRELELENELKALKEAVVDLKANMMDKETQLHTISEQNMMLQSEIRKRDIDKGRTNDNVAAELELSRAAKQEYIMKLGLAIEEADENSKRAARVAEQLEAAQAANSEMTTELRRLKVQSNQWRKAAELAAAILTAGNSGKKLIERTGSLDSSYYNPVIGNVSSPYNHDMDDALMTKKYGKLLKKIGILWRKPQK